MNLAACLLIVAARRFVDETDIDAGLHRFEVLVGQPIDPSEFRAAVAEAVAAGDLCDPVRILPGALQCRWQLELAPNGAAKLAGMLGAICAGNDRVSARAYL